MHNENLTITQNKKEEIFKRITSIVDSCKTIGDNSDEMNKYKLLTIQYQLCEVKGIIWTLSCIFDDNVVISENIKYIPNNLCDNKIDKVEEGIKELKELLNID